MILNTLAGLSPPQPYALYSIDDEPMPTRYHEARDSTSLIIIFVRTDAPLPPPAPIYPRHCLSDSRQLVEPDHSPLAQVPRPRPSAILCIGRYIKMRMRMMASRRERGQFAKGCISSAVCHRLAGELLARLLHYLLALRDGMPV